MTIGNQIHYLYLLGLGVVDISIQNKPSFSYYQVMVIIGYLSLLPQEALLL